LIRGCPIGIVVRDIPIIIGGFCNFAFATIPLPTVRAIVPTMLAGIVGVVAGGRIGVNLIIVTVAFSTRTFHLASEVYLFCILCKVLFCKI